LEEREVGAVADAIDVGCAKAFLDGAQPAGGRTGSPEHVRDHLLHPRGRQQNGRIVLGDEAGAREWQVISSGKEANEGLSDALAGPFGCVPGTTHASRMPPELWAGSYPRGALSLRTARRQSPSRCCRTIRRERRRCCA